MYSIHYTATMKNKNILILIISFIILLVACSALSMSAVASNYRYTWVAMNPWNGVEGIAFTVGYFLHTGKTVSMLITIGVLLEIWWRLFALIHRPFFSFAASGCVSLQLLKTTEIGSFDHPVIS